MVREVVKANEPDSGFWNDELLIFDFPPRPDFETDGEHGWNRQDTLNVVITRRLKRTLPDKRRVSSGRRSERIEFGIEGFRRGGVVLTRRDMLELFSKAPESAGKLYPLIQAELASLIQAELSSEAID